MACRPVSKRASTRDATTMETFTRDDSDELLRGFLAPRFLELGLIARIAGDEPTAHKRFMETLRYDANHVEAVREKRLADSRLKKDAADKKHDKSLLGKFLKR